MALIKWSPFWELERFFEEFEPLRDKVLEFWSGEFRMPRMDLYEEDGNLVAVFEMPGVKPEDVEVTISDGILHVKAERRKEEETKERGYYRREIRWDSYYRAIDLPVDVLEDKITAEMDQTGVLRVVMPLAGKPQTKPKKIKVKKAK